MRCERTFVQRKHCRHHHHRTTFWNTPSRDDNAIHLHTSRYGRSPETAATMNLATGQGLDTEQRKKTQCKKTAHLGFLPHREWEAQPNRALPVLVPSKYIQHGRRVMPNPRSRDQVFPLHKTLYSRTGFSEERHSDWVKTVCYSVFFFTALRRGRRITHYPSLASTTIIPTMTTFFTGLSI